MKATLEFNLPEEETEYYYATNGSRFNFVICHLDAKLRNLDKYDDVHEGAVADVRRWIGELCEESDVDPWRD